MREQSAASTRFRATVALLATGAVLLAVGCGDGSAGDESTFGYDRSAPLDVDDRGIVSEADGVVLRDLSFETPTGRVEAVMLAPRDAEGLPGVVIVHGSGGDRTSMIAPAAWLAARGAVVITLTQPSSSSRPPRQLDPESRLRWYRKIEVGDVVAVRRAVDLLQSRPEVDRDRIGYLGYSAGARTGALLAGSEPRLQAIALLAGGAADVESFVAAAPEEPRAPLRATMSAVDPLRWIALADGKRLLLQNAEDDEIVPRESAEALIDAAPEGADVRWYDGGHGLSAEVYADALDWLAERLPVDGPAVPGAPTGP
ncbi:MAG: alpha/beta hydrolase family protein [Gaiella sp.]